MSVFSCLRVCVLLFVLVVAMTAAGLDAAEEVRDPKTDLPQMNLVTRSVLDDMNFSRLPIDRGLIPGLARQERTITADNRESKESTTLLVNTGLRAGQVLVPINMSQVIELNGSFNEVSIGNPDIADVVPLTTSSIYVFGKQFGTTSLTVTGSRGEVMAVVDLVVSFNIEELKRQLHELVPGYRFEVRPAQDGLVLSGQVGSTAALDPARGIARRDRPVVKQLGVSNAFAVNGNDAQAVARSGDGPAIDPPAFAIAEIAATIGDVTLDVLLDTLEDKGVVKTLAEPNLIALSGDSAEFLAGGEFPIPVSATKDAAGDREITIEFKEFGISLSFTPTVLASDFINLELFTEVSEIDPNTSILANDLVIPGLKVRRARTTVELGDGQSFAIAGLLQEDFEDAVRQFPILGDVPILGTLFRSSAWRSGQTELVVIVTPHLVRPVRPTALLGPDELFVPPTESELFLLGKTEGGLPSRDRPDKRASSPGLISAAGIVGAYGYILK